jgi:release factor glutamine methyltransferase
MAREPETASLAGLTVREALRRLAQRLDAGLIETPAIDARRLLADALGATAGDLVREPERCLTESEGTILDLYARRRLGHEPVSRILGRRAFYGRDFIVTPATLDPRPCSETLIDAVLQVAAEEGWSKKPVRVLDIGTGTGCLVLTLLAELPHATALATDISREALETARSNAAQLGLLNRIEFQERHFLEGLSESFDVLISNPPYISTAEIAGLDADVREFDPFTALDGGSDGLQAYRQIGTDLSRVVPAGWAFFEVGAGQAQDVAGLLAERTPGGRDIRVFSDLGGHVRCVALKTHKLP